MLRHSQMLVQFTTTSGTLTGQRTHTHYNKRSMLQNQESNMKFGTSVDLNDAGTRVVIGAEKASQLLER